MTIRYGSTYDDLFSRVKQKAAEGTRVACYLVNDYYEDFCSTTRDWVSTHLNVLAHGNGARQPAVGLRDLYTAHVIPDEMLFLWNSGLGSLSHVLDVWRFSQFIIGTLLKVGFL